MSSQKPTGRPTINDVAKVAGVSSMTVSRVIRKERYVKPETVRKVNNAIAELGYRTNPMVQTLMSSVRRRNVNLASNIAWIEQKREAPKRVHILREGARKRAIELGFGFEEIILEDDHISSQRMDNILQARGVHGAIIAPLRAPGGTIDFPWEKYAIGTIGTSLGSPLLSHTMMHNQHAMERLLKEVRARGYERIAFLSVGDLDFRSQNVHTMTFLYYNTLIPARLRIPPLRIDGVKHQDIAKWIHKHKPDAIISSYPEMITTLRGLGFDVPETMGFASLSWWEEYAHVSSIRNAGDAAGSGVVDIVVAQIHRNERGIPLKPKTVMVDGDWFPGDTLPGK